ncbi:MAG: REDY-like protein HapK [Gammaproteobacteria bacterium]
MTKLVVLFNLKADADRAAYEAWAQATDLPIVRDLPSVDSFTVHKVSGLFGTDAPAPYEYVEIIDINSLDQFGADVSTETMGKVAGEFQAFADNPVFMLTGDLEG